METNKQLVFPVIAESSEHLNPRVERERKRHQATEVGVAVYGLESRIIKEFERDFEREFGK